MAWSDKPTDNQINAWYSLVDRGASISRDKVKAAAEWLENHADRRQASNELGRVRDLFINRKLNTENCFDSPLWDGFNYEESSK